MRKIVSQIRDIEVIEKELTACPSGVLAVILKNEKLAQLATPFIYLNKNIFIFFNDESELYSNLHFDSNVSFTIIKTGKAKKTKSMNYEPTYDFISINVLGKIKSVDDQKIIEDIRQNYLLKYKKFREGDFDFSALSKVIIIDSEEIHAIEETGG